MDIKDIEIGPIQKEDAFLLQAIIRMTCPTKLVEIGFLKGESARTILDAASLSSWLVSYDIACKPEDARLIVNDPRFFFKQKNQIDYDEQNVDFIFIDGAHDLELNKQLFHKVVHSLTPGAIVAIHDTGAWSKMWVDNGGITINGEYLHQPHERTFVNWIKKTYPEFQMIHFHTKKEIRHGMTILQFLINDLSN